LTLRAKIPWDKLSSIITGVIRPLRDKGGTPEITIEIKAKTDGNFDRTTLDSKVKETLQQIKDGDRRMERGIMLKGHTAYNTA